MRLCTQEELTVSLVKLALAFDSDFVTIGCRLELALNLIRTALKSVNDDSRQQINVLLVTTIMAGCPEPAAAPELAIVSGAAGTSVH